MARRVAPGIAHHITQRGTNRQVVFRSQQDRRVYLDHLRRHSAFADVSILAYCLMPNHIHLIAVPRAVDGLALMLRRVHGMYAQYFNGRTSRSGHLWQNRFYSCPLSESHLWTAIRYVELNPVRAALVAAPELYRWSSADAHLSGEDRDRLLDMSFFRSSGGVSLWKEMLQQPDDGESEAALRKATYAGNPFGDPSFVASLHTIGQSSEDGLDAKPLVFAAT